MSYMERAAFHKRDFNITKGPFGGTPPPPTPEVIRIAEATFDATALAGVITFDEFPLNTSNPFYTASDYGGVVGVVPSVQFFGQFESRGRGTGLPFGPDWYYYGGPFFTPLIYGDAALTPPYTGLTTTRIQEDVSISNARVLLGGFSGADGFINPRIMWFDQDVVGVQFKSGIWNALGAARVRVYDRDANVLWSGTNLTTGLTGYEDFSLVERILPGRIAGLELESNIDLDNSGFGIKFVKFTATPAG